MKKVGDFPHRSISFNNFSMTKSESNNREELLCFNKRIKRECVLKSVLQSYKLRHVCRVIKYTNGKSDRIIDLFSRKGIGG